MNLGICLEYVEAEDWILDYKHCEVNTQDTLKVNKTYFIGTKVKYSLILGVKNGICLFSPRGHV